MEIQVEVSDDGGAHREYIGIEVCRGPGVMRMLLTRPYRMAGRTVNVPIDHVESVVEVESGVLGDPVKAVEPAGSPRAAARATEHHDDDDRARRRR